MRRTSYEEYQDISLLMKGKEWAAWVRFLLERKETLTKKALDKIRSGEIVEAQKIVAVIDDVDKQVSLFNNRRKELEKELEEE